MRDKTGYKSDFNGLIDVLTKRVEKFQNAIQAGQVVQDRFYDIKTAILKSNIEITISHYSSGSDKLIITNSLLESIKSFEEIFTWDVKYPDAGKYDKLCWIISLAILCEVSIENFKRISNIVRRDNVKDKLLDFLINSRLNNDWPIVSHSYVEPNPYKDVVNFNSAVEIKKYLDNIWYQDMKEAYFYDSHADEKVNTYFGYWAWEVAAIVKIKGIDDSSLKDQKYYPYDAVHW